MCGAEREHVYGALAERKGFRDVGSTEDLVRYPRLGADKDADAAKQDV
jgi:hypothetical protein